MRELMWIGIAMVSLLAGCHKHSSRCGRGGDLLVADGTEACVYPLDAAHSCPEQMPAGYQFYEVLICAAQDLADAELETFRNAYLDAHPDTPPVTPRAVCAPESLDDVPTFDACGKTYLVLPPPPTDGWSSASATVDSDPPYPFAFPVVEFADAGVFVTDASRGRGVLVLGSDGAATAWWAAQTPLYDEETGDSAVEVSAKASGGIVVLRSTTGISVLGWDGGVPDEHYCISESYSVAEVSEDWVMNARIEDGVADLRSVDDPMVVGTVPLPFEGVGALDGNRVVAVDHDRKAVLYEVDASGVQTLGEIPDPGIGELPAVAGGFAYGEGEGSARAAIDMHDAVPEAYTLLQDSENACVFAARRESDSTITAWVVPKPIRPSDRGRFTSREDALGVPCPADGGRRLSPLNSALLATREPGGTRVLFLNGSGEDQNLTDLVTGETTNFQFPAQPLDMLWSGDTVAVVYTEGSDWNIPIDAWVTFYDEAGDGFDPGVRVDLPGPWVASAANDAGLWVVAESAGRDYGDPRPSTSTNVLLHSAFADRSLQPLSLPGGFAPIGVVAHGATAWLFGDGRRLARVAADGTVTELSGADDARFRQTVTEIGAQVGDAVAGPFGMLAMGTNGRMWWATADGTMLLPSAEPCLESVPVGSIGDDPLVVTRRPGGLGISGFYELQRLVLTEGATTFGISVEARLPVRQNAMVVAGSSADEAVVLTPGIPAVVR